MMDVWFGTLQSSFTLQVLPRERLLQSTKQKSDCDELYQADSFSPRLLACCRIAPSQP